MLMTPRRGQPTRALLIDPGAHGEALRLVEEELELARRFGAPGALAGPQVADLAAQGMSNREIAEALFVTLKTVEWHLRHIYEKLEISSRNELRGMLDGNAGQD